MSQKSRTTEQRVPRGLSTRDDYGAAVAGDSEAQPNAGASDAAADDDIEAMERSAEQEKPESASIPSVAPVSPERVTRGGKRIVQWPGKAFPVTCPNPDCGAVVLLDNSTQACVVTTTRDEVDGIIDRDMQCRFCGCMFIARENSRVMEFRK